MFPNANSELLEKNLVKYIYSSAKNNKTLKSKLKWGDERPAHWKL